jgi:UDP-glucuronate 4-epimerase
MGRPIITVLVSGVAGFIGSHVAGRLLEAGHTVIGIDNLNAYYDPKLKQARLARLVSKNGFSFHSVDIADHSAVMDLPERKDLTQIIHLAAQAGVRHSIDNPFAYAASNLTGHLSMLELARHAPQLQRMVYASSSSVYGMGHTPPYRETERVDCPVSLYAATKASNEVMSQAYSHLYGLSLIGLRFFTVYGAWGRPDMAYWLFTEALLSGQPIKVFNHGRMRRDFTYIDDIVSGVMATTFRPFEFEAGRPRHAIYNIGNNRPVELMEMIGILERATGHEATLQMMGMQPGDVVETCADLTAISRDFGFAPATALEEGLAYFVDWYRSWREG